MEGEPEYKLLHQIESIVFRRIPRQLGSQQFNWEDHFKQLIIKFEGIFDQLQIRIGNSQTMYLLKGLFPGTTTTSRLLASSSLSSSVSSSVETMPIIDKGPPPQEKLTSIIEQTSSLLTEHESLNK